MRTPIGFENAYVSLQQCVSGQASGSLPRLCFGDPNLVTSLPHSDFGTNVAQRLCVTGTIEQSPGLLTILVVEDDPYLRNLIARLLMRKGLVIFDDGGCPLRHQVLIESDGRSALESATRSRRPVDLLITDICLGEGDGISLSENLRTRYPRLAVLFTTAYIDEFFSYPALYERRSRVLIKPFTKHRLFAVIEDLLSVNVHPPS